MSKTPEESGYRVYTRAFDRVVTADQLDTVLGPLSVTQKAALQDAWEQFEGSLLAWKTKAHLVALELAKAVRQRASNEDRSDTVVALLVDQSGSMRGQTMLLAAGAVDIAQDFLGHLGCKVEILGFTTTSWRGGRSRRRWTWRFSSRRPGRLCDLLHVIYRNADDQRASTGGWALRSMLRPDLPKENVDGEALQWAAQRLKDRPEKRKILVVLSDGAPVDDSTLLANDPLILHQHLHEVVNSLTDEGEVELAAVGIGFDVSTYYPHSRVIETPDDLGVALVQLLARTLTGKAASPLETTP